MPYIPPPQRHDPLEMEYMTARLAILESDMPDDQKRAALREAKAKYERKKAVENRLTCPYLAAIIIGTFGFMAGASFALSKSLLAGIAVYVGLFIFIIFMARSLQRRIDEA